MCNSTSDLQKKGYNVLLVNFLFTPVLIYTKVFLQKTQLKNKLVHNVNTS